MRLVIAEMMPASRKQAVRQKLLEKKNGPNMGNAKGENECRQSNWHAPGRGAGIVWL